MEGLYSPLFQPSEKAEKVVSSVRTIKTHIKHTLLPNMPGSEALLLELLPHCIGEDIQT